MAILVANANPSSVDWPQGNPWHLGLIWRNAPFDCNDDARAAGSDAVPYVMSGTLDRTGWEHVRPSNYVCLSLYSCLKHLYIFICLYIDPKIRSGLVICHMKNINRMWTSRLICSWAANYFRHCLEDFCLEDFRSTTLQLGLLQ